VGKAAEAARLLVGADPAWARELAAPEVIAAAEALLGAAGVDVVHVEFGTLAFLAEVVRRVAPDARLVITEHEPGWIAGRSSERSGLKRRLNAWVEARAWRRFARRWLPLADAVVTFTPEDRNEVRALLGRDAPPVCIIPLRISRAPPGERDGNDAVPIASDLLFVGNYRHPPNEDAARRLASGILPRIAAARPGTQLTLVGVDPPADLPPSDGMVVTGAVPSTAPYLAGTKLVIVPLRQGGGMRVKVLEALAAGKPVIASSLAVAGLPLSPGHDYAPAESDAEFAAAALALLGDPARCRSLGEAGRAWFDGHNMENAAVEDYEKLYKQLEDWGRPR
jgi:glycosyltransferase involved in cell wall biosynthesis